MIKKKNSAKQEIRIGVVRLAFGDWQEHHKTGDKETEESIDGGVKRVNYWANDWDRSNVWVRPAFGHWYHQDRG